MREKERFVYLVVGAAIGAVLLLIGMAVSPLGAQNDLKDAEFGTITCRKIMVVGWDDKAYAVMSAGKDGGLVSVYGKDGDPRAGMIANEEGGSVDVFGKGNNKLRASVGVVANGNGVVVVCDKNGIHLGSVKWER